MASRYDLRMEEIARQQAETRYELAQLDQQNRANDEAIDRIKESTETINAGMSDPVNWLLCVAAFVLIPVTGGLSVGLAIVALLRATKGGKANVQAIQPTLADVSSPGPACVRILAALGVLVVMILMILLFLAIVAYNMGVQP